MVCKVTRQTLKA